MCTCMAQILMYCSTDAEGLPDVSKGFFLLLLIENVFSIYYQETNFSLYALVFRQEVINCIGRHTIMSIVTSN